MNATDYKNRIVETGAADPRMLAPNPRNPRRHPKAQRGAMAGILEEVGWLEPVIYNRTTGRLVNGHLRVEEAIRHGDAKVPVTYVEMDEPTEALALVAFDRIGWMAENQADILDSLLRDVSTGNADVQAMLAEMAADSKLDWGQTEPAEDPGAQVDRAEELREKWGVERGQLWEIGAHRLLCGDSTDAGDVARLMGGERAALMATDPPYLVNYQGGNHPQSWANSPETKDKHWDDYEEGDGPAFFAEFIRAAIGDALTGNPVVYQWHASRRQSLVEQAWSINGLLWHQSIVWVKSRPVLTRSHFMGQSEPCAYGWIEGKAIDQRPPSNERNVWEIDQQGEQDGIHPTQKPVELFARPMRWHIPAGGLAYEPFSGSGTALVAAEQEGRRCYAMEIAPAFVAVALERLAGMGLEPRLMP